MTRRRVLSSGLLLLCLVLGTSAAWGAWMKDGVSLCDAIEWQINLKAVTDDSGGAVVVWMDRRNMSD